MNLWRNKVSKLYSIQKRELSSLFFLSIKNVSYSVGDKKIIDNLNLEFFYDRILLIKGRVGSGKTTFLKILAELINPSAGSINHIRVRNNFAGKQSSTSNGDDISTLSDKEDLQKKLVFEGREVIGSRISDFAYIHSQSEFNFTTGFIDDELVLAKVPKKTFSAYIGKSVSELSGGELKKISVMISVLSNDSSVILLDEPLDMLDDNEADKIGNLIVKESKNRPFIIASHDPFFDKYADVIIEISEADNL